jgi:CRISPR-associated protein Cas1
MTDRVLDISETPVQFHARGELLVLRPEGGEESTIPFEEIAAIVVGHPRVMFSQSALAGLAAGGAVVVVCDDKRMPAGMMLPTQGHFVQGERFARQAAAPLPLRKRVWRDVVRAKIINQGKVLAALRGSDGGLSHMAKGVRSGDTGNHEAIAAQRYWPLLFNDRKFRRDRMAEDQNRLLNYGYAVLRAIMARAICGAGLHPSLGLHHHNRYDAFRLASDLMEPYRPIVDRNVAAMVGELGINAPLDRSTKSKLINPLLGRFELRGEKRTFFDIANSMSQSLARIYEGGNETLVIADL